MTGDSTTLDGKAMRATFSLAVLMLCVFVTAQFLAILRISHHLLVFVGGCTPSLVLSYYCYKNPVPRRRNRLLQVAVMLSFIALYLVSIGPLCVLADFMGQYDRVIYYLYWPVFWICENTEYWPMINDYAQYWRGYS